jgi:DNA-binding LacI/PurR family transcriptional regulator
VNEFRLECRPEWIRSGEFVSNHGYEAAKAILTLPERPTSLFCSNDEMALGAIQAAKELGLSVPEDLSIVGFDDVPLSRIVTPNLTTVRQPTQELAQLATRALIGHVEGRGRTPSVQPIQSVTLPNQLVIRQSTTRPKEDT